MSFKIPSANNSTNERRASRANWKSNVRKNKNIVSELVEMAKRNEVSKSEGGYTVKTFLSTYEITAGENGWQCRCSDKRDLGTCSHIIAVETFAAALEAEKQAKIAVSRKIIADIETAGAEKAEKCFWCHDENITTAEGELVPCAFCDRQPSDEFLFRAGENELYYDNGGLWEALAQVYVCQLCGKPSDTGFEHSFCMDAENHWAQAAADAMDEDHDEYRYAEAA